MSNEILEEALNSSFVSPEREFKGEKLAPYTEGSRLLLQQIRDDGDSGMFFVWAFLFTHILLKKDRKEALSLAWNKDKYRETLFEWVSKMTKEDGILAEDIVLAIISEANKGGVEAVPQAHKLPEQPGNK